MTVKYRVAKEISTELSWDSDYHRTYTSIWHVLDDFDQAPADAATGVGLPDYGSTYTWFTKTDPWAVCLSVKVKRGKKRIANPGGKDRAIWVCTVTHSSKPQQTNQFVPRENPLDQPPIISGNFQNYKKQAHRDKDGNPVQNSARQPYNPVPEIDDAFDTVVIKVNTASIDLAQRAGYRGKVNSDALWGLVARQIKLAKWAWRKQRVGTGFSYIENTLEFHISYEQHPTDPHNGPSGKIGWYTTRPDSGMIYYEDGTFDADHELHFSDREDHPKGEPGKLKDDGDRLPDATPVNYNVFLLEPELPFLALPGVTLTLDV